MPMAAQVHHDDPKRGSNVADLQRSRDLLRRRLARMDVNLRACASIIAHLKEQKPFPEILTEVELRVEGALRGWDGALARIDELNGNLSLTQERLRDTNARLEAIMDQCRVEHDPGAILPEQRYLRDADFKMMVDLLEAEIMRAHYTPTELREAATLAAIRYEIHHGPAPIYLRGRPFGDGQKAAG